MTQNRNKLLDLLVGNLANAVVHKVLEDATEDEPLSDNGAAEAKERITNKAEAELKLRIAKGYENINLGSVEEVTKKILADLRIISRSS